MARRRRRGDAGKAVALLRVSTLKQDVGPEVQREAIGRWAGREGVEVVAWCEERGVSGAADPLSRPGLQAALDNLERDMIVEALRESAGNKAKAARALGISERLMGLRVVKHGIDPRQFRTVS